MHTISLFLLKKAAAIHISPGEYDWQQPFVMVESCPAGGIGDIMGCGSLCLWCLTALSFYQVVRHDNLGGGHIWMLNKIDELAGRLNSQLA